MTKLAKRALTAKECKAFFATLAKTNPEPKTELRYTNAYTLLVAVICSAQATDIGVNRATKELFRKVKTPQAMLALGEEGLREHIKSIGLYRNKAKNVIAMSQMLIAEYGGKLPRTREELIRLAGVGRKTANVVLNVLYGEETFAVDTHVFRLSNRTGLALGKNPDAVEAGLEKRVPAPYRQYAHHWLILHGRYVCLARKPKCPECAVASVCQYKAKEGEAPK